MSLDTAAIGSTFRRWRLLSRRRQADVAADIDVSQATVSRIERGLIASVRLETLDRLAGALGLDLSLSASPPLPQRDGDIQMRCHRLIADTAAGGGWTAWTSTTGTDPIRWETRLERRDRREVAVVRAWDVVGDVEASVADVERSVERERATCPGVKVAAAVVVVQAGINTRRLGERARIVNGAFPARGALWLAALRTAVPMPSEAGLIWTSAGVERLRPFVPYVDRRCRTRGRPR